MRRNVRRLSREVLEPLYQSSTDAVVDRSPLEGLLATTDLNLSSDDDDNDRNNEREKKAALKLKLKRKGHDKKQKSTKRVGGKKRKSSKHDDDDDFEHDNDVDNDNGNGNDNNRQHRHDDRAKRKSSKRKKDVVLEERIRKEGLHRQSRTGSKKISVRDDRKGRRVVPLVTPVAARAAVALMAKQQAVSQAADVAKKRKATSKAVRQATGLAG